MSGADIGSLHVKLRLDKPTGSERKLTFLTLAEVGILCFWYDF